MLSTEVEEIFFEDLSKHFRQVMCRVGMGCLCWNFHMLCDKISIYPRFAVHLCQDSHLNVHWNKKCSVFHICLFSERYDFCDFDIGCSSVSTNFVKHRTMLYWIVKSERWFRPNWAAKNASKQTWRFTSEVISLAVLWTDSRTHQDSLGEFWLVSISYNISLVGLGGPTLQKIL